MRTENQSIALHQMLRLLGGSVTGASLDERFNQIHGASRIINWLDCKSADSDTVWDAALALWRESHDQ